MNYQKVAGGLLLALLCVVGCSRGPAGDEFVVPSSVDTADFNGRYELVAASSFVELRKQLSSIQDEARKQSSLQVLEFYEKQFSNFRISNGVIRSGDDLIQEFSLRTGAATGSTLLGTAIWHEDIYDPGDAATVSVSLKLDGQLLKFAYGLVGEQLTEPVVLKRIAD